MRINKTTFQSMIQQPNIVLMKLYRTSDCFFNVAVKNRLDIQKSPPALKSIRASSHGLIKVALAHEIYIIKHVKCTISLSPITIKIF